MDEDMKRLTARRDQLFAPIEKQILMTDDNTDVVLLAINMLTSSIHIFCNNYGFSETEKIVNDILNQSRIKYN